MHIKILIAASEAFLCEPLPESWENLSQETQDEFLEEHVWHPLEDREPHQIMDLIEGHALTIERMMGELNQCDLDLIRAKL